jgi:hypothetical protein
VLAFGLELIAPFLQISDQLIRLCLGIGFLLACLDLERRQCGIHLVKPLLGPIQVDVHAAMFWHNRLLSSAGDTRPHEFLNFEVGAVFRAVLEWPKVRASST